MSAQTYAVTSTTLSGANEVPSNSSPGTGTLVGTYDATTNQITLTASYSGMEGNLTASHLHRAPTGSNGPVIRNLNPTTGSNNGTIAGTYSINQSDEANLIAGNVYINLHSSVYGGGELRDQLALELTSPLPISQVAADEGDVVVTSSLYGVILSSPDGTCFRVTVDDDGMLSTTEVSCPN